ncbi:hypothetical protein IV203_004537 [Nitzschia inconspicua]|uniref:DUF6816 domain-containing protein n=1 Tax=Nitzschia inconspicua TaxID=303405 RepID=A0A9K3PQ62_9STRA|nr:hypothetical protein IV203_004537 [Nitzschia inconspicua]
MNEESLVTENSFSSPTRRSFFKSSLFLNSLLIGTSFPSSVPANAAAVLPSESVKLDVGLLESRVDSNVLNPPPYGMEGTDIFYPSWFAGTWKVSSTTKEIQAPLGVGLFGGNSTYQAALNDVGDVLRYESRFITTDATPSNNDNDNNAKIIADREYNVRSIAKVAMGENSVVDVSTATPNKFSCVVAPKGAPSMISVDLLVLNRRQETVGPNRFDCSEVVREIATPIDRPKQQQQQQPALLKEIETTSLYTYHPETDEIHCRQRSAAFLLPSDQNEMAMKLWQLSRGQAIDVRFYDVVYTRRKES